MSIAASRILDQNVFVQPTFIFPPGTSHMDVGAPSEYITRTFCFCFLNNYVQVFLCVCLAFVQRSELATQHGDHTDLTNRRLPQNESRKIFPEKYARICIKSYLITSLVWRRSNSLRSCAVPWPDKMTWSCFVGQVTEFTF